MRLFSFILMVCLAACQTSVPTPRKHPGAHGDTSNSVRQQPNQKQGDATAPSATPLDATKTTSQAANSEGESSENKEERAIKITSVPKIETRTGWPEIGYVLFSFLLVVVGGFQVWLLCRTLLFTRRQSHEMTRQRRYMRLQWKVMEQQFTEAKNQTVAMRQQAGAMWEQFKMTLAREMARLTVDIGGLDLHAPSPPASIEIIVNHFGPTEAYNVFGDGAIVVADSDEFPKGTELFGIGLPQVIRPQDEPFTAEVYRIPGLTEDEISRIEDGKAILHVVGKISFFTFRNDQLSCPFWYVWRSVWDSPAEGVPPIDMSHWEPRAHPDIGKPE